mmetsp:Transcript_69168/g.164960  ORF Transcript_69168/g.164960 Transcript_69168/m.164960 type:complete len:202 (+) Transcript_69168:702-1307(+)
MRGSARPASNFRMTSAPSREVALICLIPASTGSPLRYPGAPLLESVACSRGVPSPLVFASRKDTRKVWGTCSCPSASGGVCRRVTTADASARMPFPSRTRLSWRSLSAFAHNAPPWMIWGDGIPSAVGTAKSCPDATSTVTDTDTRSHRAGSAHVSTCPGGCLAIKSFPRSRPASNMVPAAHAVSIGPPEEHGSDDAWFWK